MNLKVLQDIIFILNPQNNRIISMDMLLLRVEKIQVGQVKIYHLEEFMNLEFYHIKQLIQKFIKAIMRKFLQ